MTDQERDELVARVTALEHLLETGYAAWMAQMSGEQYREFEKHFEHRMRVTWPLAVECFGHMLEPREDILREAQGIAARFWKRARDREREIRRDRSNGR